MSDTMGHHLRRRQEMEGLYMDKGYTYYQFDQIYHGANLEASKSTTIQQ